MGKASRWLKRLLGMKKHKENMENMDKKDKKNWSFMKPESPSPSPSPQPPVPATADTNPPSAGDSTWLRSYTTFETEKERNKHAIAVAAATAAAADAAVAAAQAAVAVVRLTSLGRGTVFNGGGGERWAAVKIQTNFRGHLARKALRALKGLVKLQALVRGFLVRKRAAATLYSMQALLRAQTAVRSHQQARRSLKDRQDRPETRHRKSTERCEQETRSEFHSKRLSTSYESATNSYDESPKIVEIDMCRPRARSRRIHTCTTDSSDESHCHHNMSSPLPCNISTRMSIECGHFQDPDWGFIGEKYKYSNTTQSTPRLAKLNAPPTPARSVCGDFYFRPYSNHPSYMANTQSFNAKQRSHSTPKQRPEMRNKRRQTLIEIMASRSSFSGLRMQRSCTKAQEAINS